MAFGYELPYNLINISDRKSRVCRALMYMIYFVVVTKLLVKNGIAALSYKIFPNKHL